MRLYLFLISGIVLVLALQACHPNPTPTSATAADAVARRLLGHAVPYQNMALSSAEKAELTGSLEATRAAAWQVFAQVVAPTTVDVTSPNGSQLAITLPKVFTWYSPEDIQRLMRLSYSAADPQDLQAGTQLSSDLFQSSQQLLATELDRMPSPLQKKLQRYLNDHPNPTAAEILGLAGFNRTLFSPDLIGSVVRRYAELQDCFPQGQKPLPETAFHPCWQAPLPTSSVMVKAAWLNTRSAYRSFATDATSLRTLFASEDSSWAQHAETIPVPKDIVHARNADQDFVLGGLHIVTKDLDDWLWITAFWSADPDGDFGSDRPEAVKALGAPWNQYKLCAVSSYSQDPKEIDKIAIKYPELAAVYRAVLDGAGGASWCSNPYIEQGVHNHRSNCIGCHQFAGTQIQQEQILNDASRFPQLGTLKQRQDFPSDYIWAATQGSMGWLSLMNTFLYSRLTQP